MISVGQKKYFYRIDLKTKRFGGEHIESLYWDGFTLDQHVRWLWYFRYRAALLQVKHPKLCVEEAWGPYDPNPADQAEILNRRLIARKRKITEWKNKLRKAEETWNELFPIEDDLFYKKAVAKIAKDELLLSELKQTINSLKHGNPI
jgi:hypothetical protein